MLLNTRFQLCAFHSVLWLFLLMACVLGRPAVPARSARNATLDFQLTNHTADANGTSALDVAVLGDKTFVVVAQARNDAGEYGINSTICIMDEDGALTPVVTFPTQGAVEARWLPIADSEHPDCVYLFVGNGNDGETVNVNSTVYRFDGQSLTVVQHFLTHSVGRVAFLPAYGGYYLMVPNGNNGATPYLDSVLYHWNEERGLFEVFLLVPTRGALCACYLSLDGLPHVFIGNAFGDSVLYYFSGEALYARQSFTLYNPNFCIGWRRAGQDYAMVAIHYSQGQYLTDSLVFRFESVIGQLVSFTSVQTQGATHLTHLIHTGEHYVHVANLRDANYLVESTFYRQTDTAFEVEQHFAGKGRTGLACVGMADVLRCVATDSYDGQSRRHPLQVYEETLNPWFPPPPPTPPPTAPPVPMPTSDAGGGGDDLGGDALAGIVIALVIAIVFCGVVISKKCNPLSGSHEYEGLNH